MRTFPTCQWGTGPWDRGPLPDRTIVLRWSPELTWHGRGRSHDALSFSFSSSCSYSGPSSPPPFGGSNTSTMVVNCFPFLARFLWRASSFSSSDRFFKAGSSASAAERPASSKTRPWPASGCASFWPVGLSPLILVTSSSTYFLHGLFLTHSIRCSARCPRGTFLNLSVWKSRFLPRRPCRQDLSPLLQKCTSNSQFASFPGPELSHQRRWSSETDRNVISAHCPLAVSILSSLPNTVPC